MICVMLNVCILGAQPPLAGSTLSVGGKRLKSVLFFVAPASRFGHPRFVTSLHVTQ